MHTPETVYRDLPPVGVIINGKQHTATLCRVPDSDGRFVLARIPLAGAYAGVVLDCEWSTKSAADALNAGRPLRYN